IVLALDAVQDPGNVGTIVRTAAWFGVRSLLLGVGTADVYAPKVIRSTQGAIFSVSMESLVDLVGRLKVLQNEGWKVIATVLDTGAHSIYEWRQDGKAILLLGSEAHGISPELIALSEECVMIPRYGEGESLNVATSAAIVL